MDQSLSDGSHHPGVRLSLLGRFEVASAGLPLPPAAWARRGGDARRLLKLLAVERKHMLHRELIQERLWPDVAPHAVRNRLHKALHAARHALQPDLAPGDESVYVVSHGELLCFATDRVWVDIDEFEVRARQALRTRCEDDLHAACQLYVGDLLPEDRYEEWLLERRNELAELYSGVLLALAHRRQEVGDGVGALELWQAVLAIDPLDERAHRAIMAHHTARGRSNAALRHYRKVRAIVRKELETDPEQETQQLYEDIRARRRRGASRTSPITPHRWLPPIVPRLSPSPFIGREAALAELRGAVSDLVAGRGGMVFLGGEAGVGKSRLVAELARQAHERGVLVLWGTGEGDGQPAYGPLTGAIENFVSTLTAANRQLIGRRFPVLAPIVPALAAGSRIRSLPVKAGSPQVATALLTFLRWLSRREPVILVLDDTHHTATETLHLVRQLARDAERSRWLIVGTFREEEIVPGDALDSLLAVLRRDGLGSTMRLSRLTREQSTRLICTRLAGAAVPEVLLDHLYARALGNPLFLLDLLDAMRAAELMIPRNGRWYAEPNTATSILPSSPRELVRARLARLDALAQRLVQLAAVLGTERPVADLMVTAPSAFPGLHHTDLHDTLERAISSGILVGSGDSYLFRSPLFREAVLAMMPGHWRDYLREIVEGLDGKEGR